MGKAYGDVEYTKEDIERIIENKKWRLAELSDCWESITKHMECGEIRELKQSCIDDEIIISVLEQAKYLQSLIDTWNRINKETLDKAEKLATNLPSVYNFEEGNYILRFDSDIWDVETACKFHAALSEVYSNSSFTLLPYEMELINETS